MLMTRHAAPRGNVIVARCIVRDGLTGRRYLKVRFKKTKTDQRVERPEGRRHMGRCLMSECSCVSGRMGMATMRVHMQ